jgi:cob(I)alamin adenosyltransferase
VALREHERLSEASLAYVNRLSDLLFILAREANQPGGEVEWVPGENR